MNTLSSRRSYAPGLRSVRRVMLGGAMLVTVVLVIPSATLADDCATTERLAAHAGLSPGQRSIVLVEGQDPANFPTTTIDC